MNHSFGEKTKEFSARDGKELPVIVTPKYTETKRKVVEMLESDQFKGLNDSHFWILMNATKTGKMAYTGLIISHDGMKIINDNLKDNGVKPEFFSMPIKSDYMPDCLYMVYQDAETFEIGEISTKNCKNEYPYAMLLKRTFDRVVKDKAKLYGVYSEAEADEFKEKIEDVPDTKEPESVYECLKELYTEQEIQKLCTGYKIEKIEDLELGKAIKYLNDRKGKYEDHK